MPASDSPAIIVARFLKANHYSESYHAFINEAGLPQTAGNVSKGDLTLEVLLEEKKTFDLSFNFEKLGVEEEATAWTSPAPSNSEAISTLPSKTNVIHANIESALVDGTAEQLLITTTVDRHLNVLGVPSLKLLESTASLHEASILSCKVFCERYLLSTSMSGSLVLSDLHGRVQEKRRDHAKFAVQVEAFKHGEESYVATIGWDNKVNVYKPDTNCNPPLIGEPFCSAVLQTKPEAIQFSLHPTEGKPILLLSRTDSSFLHYYAIDQNLLRLLGKQNLAPHSNAWIAFTPSSFAIHPKDPMLLAVATSTVPHMKLIIVRLLVPPYIEGVKDQPTSQVGASLLDEATVTETQASRARDALAVADREAAAIQIHCSTLAPQTAYSTPALAWRPDGSGVWVNGDDGMVRGIESTTGKIVVSLQGHQPGTKVRCLWAGRITSHGRDEEWLISGGFDQKLLVWRHLTD